ncbi:hypothetical protein [Photobacterium damselae]|uniref:hypothetical protein n=1 Tax=Photobacterium damselae TaxID=38293 RepID=UPI001F3E20CE|nr:hypothetical protein [Photobacterium damselae]UKA31481.1 hypothetical protein IPQ37_16580 [Photobacterium damselae subsp. damselae]
MSAVDKKQFPLTESQFELFSNEIIKKINLETFWKVVNSNDKDVLLFDSISKFLWPLDLKCHDYIESRNINSKNDEYNNLGIKIGRLLVVKNYGHLFEGEITHYVKEITTAYLDMIFLLLLMDAVT